ncbi:ABC transporter ATP-binding protein [soil metagenome]
MTAAAIESLGLAKRFGRQEAVAGVDLLAPAGGVYGFLGPNGAGKTTSIRMILGLLRPTAGSVSVFGADVAVERRKTAAMIGSVVETPALYDRLTGRENLEVGRLLIGAPKTDIERVLEIVDLKGAADRKAGGYSQGMRQRLGLARALLGQPKLLVLDEPTNGLDPEGIREIRDLIRAAPERSGATVFVSSHLLAEVEQMASHVGVMHKGRLLAQGSLAELRGAGARTADVGVEDAERAAALLVSAGLEARSDGPASLKVILPADEEVEAIAAVNRRLVEGGFTVFRLGSQRRSLEEVYLQATGGSGASA